MDDVLVLRRSESKGDGLEVHVLRFGQAADLPASGQMNFDLVIDAVGIGEINRLRAVGMLEDMLLRRREETDGNESTLASGGCPARNLHFVFRNQGRSGTLPCRRIG